MAGAVIGALRVVLGADTAALDKGLKDSQSGLSSFAKSMAAIAGGIGLEKVLEGFVSSAVNAIKHGVELGDQLNKMSQSAGVSVEELSKLKYAADLSDVSMESLGKSMGKLSKALVSAASDGAGQAGRAFAAMGVEVRNAADGSIRPSANVLADIAEKFAGYKDGAEKTALAIALFGKAGAAMIPLLNQGRDGLREAGDEAQKFGLVLDKQTTAAAERFLDNLKRLDAIKQGLYTTIAARLLPSLEQLSEQFLETKKNSDFTATAADFVTTAIRVLGSEIALVVVQFRNAGREFQAFIDFASQAGDINDLRAGWNRWGLVVEENQDRLSTLKSSMATLGQNLDSESFVSRFSMMSAAIDSTTKETKRLQAESKKVAAPIVGETAAAKDALDKYIGSQLKSLAAHQAEIQTFGLLAGQKEALTIQLQAEAIAKTNDMEISAAQQVQLDLTKQKTMEYAQTLAGLQLQQANLTPAQLFQQEQVKIQALFDAGKISAETYGTAMENAADRAGVSWNTAGATIAGSFAELANAFGKSNKEMAIAGKAFGIIQATINTYTAFTKALASAPPPLNYALAAATLAAGMAKVAAISSQSIPSAAMGGAFRVPGGIGGGDKVLTQMRLEPGELVEVNSNRAGGYRSGGDRGSASSAGTYTLQVPDFLRPLAEVLMPHIEAANRDGHTLKLVTI